MSAIQSVHWPLRLVIALVAVMLISACKQLFSGDVVRYADKTSYMATNDTIRHVDRTFHGAFSVGEWSYQGANVRFGEVNAYIRIPQPLNMDKDIQEQYLQQIICPNEEHIDLWYSLKKVDLQVHIYTDNKNHSVSATCTNPLQNRVS